jgi:hypothetical protein
MYVILTGVSLPFVSVGMTHFGAFLSPGFTVRATGTYSA